MATEVYDKVNTAWKAACKVLFGEEPGELGEYAEWLGEYPGKPRREKSALSGKPVSLSIDEYCRGAGFVSFDELDFGKKAAPLGINEIKDIDTLVEALGERFHYAGNVVLGNSRFVEGSSDIHNSGYVLESENVLNSKYIAYTRMARDSERSFGCNGVGETKYVVRCLELTRSTRCFESFMLRFASDCFYSYNLEGCHDCLFSFNLRQKGYCIGNLELGRERYLRQKEKLVQEITDSLSGKKRVAGLLDILESAKEHKDEAREFFKGVAAKAKYRKEHTDISRVEKTFCSTTSVLLGRCLGPLRDYEEWLLRHTTKLELCKSVISGRKTGLVHYSRFDRFPRKCIVTVEEAPLLGELRLDEGEVSSLTLASAPVCLGKIAFSTTDAEVENSALTECFMVGWSSNCYRCIATPYAKDSAYSFWPKGTSGAFGCNSAHDSSFVVNGYFSSRVSRAFEVDLCRDCTDIYFSHNCEGVQDGLFCFNAKNLRRAIGNAEYPPDEYKKFKGSLLGQISSELEKNKTLKWDIYDIGCGK